MHILMLGNSFTSAQDLPRRLGKLLGAQVLSHCRGGARLAEHLNPATRLGAKTRAALTQAHWDYVVLQEMSKGPIVSPAAFFRSVTQLCRQIRQSGAQPLLYATWAYQKGSSALAATGLHYEEMFQRLYQAYHQAGSENTAAVADVGQRFFELAAHLPLYDRDGVHPSAQGAQLAAEILAAAILRLEEATKHDSGNLPG